MSIAPGWRGTNTIFRETEQRLGRRIGPDPRSIVCGPPPAADEPERMIEQLKNQERGLPNANGMEKLFELLKIHGGKIVTSNELTVLGIATARADERMWVDDDGIGYVFEPKDYSEFYRLTKGLCFETN